MNTIQDPGAGLRRGIVVFLHPSQASDLPIPFTVPNSTGLNFGDLFTPLVADGWLCMYPVCPQDFSIQGVEYFGNVYNDVKNDPTNGAFLKARFLIWWELFLHYLARKYGPGRPIIVGGFSFGAFVAMNIVVGHSSSIIGYFLHCLPTLFEYITAFGPSYNPSLVNWTNFDYSTTALTSPTSITTPGIIGWSDSDDDVGYSLTPVNSGQVQSNAIAIIAAAQAASLPVTSYQAASSSGGSTPVAYPNGHLFLPNDGTEYSNWIKSTFDASYPAGAF
jgi:hypothetical protein